MQEAFIEAITHWVADGIPDNPHGWLYKVAKNKALNALKREQFKRQSSSDVAHFLQSEWTVQPALEHFFSDEEIKDDQLRMIFTCCHPAISQDSQIALALKTLCGFGIREIAKAFLTSEENINKRLVRARRKIREDKIPFDVPVGNALENRLKAVLETIYLMFNEGYKASFGDELIKYELAEEAIRLAQMLISHPAIIEKQLIHALLALMQLNASRFKARYDEHGHIQTLQHQNRSLWDKMLMRKGFLNLQKSQPHDYISKYHILAVISAYHCAAPTFEDTNWTGILHEYNRLIKLDASPIVRLNQAIAQAKVEGPRSGLESLKKIRGLKDYYLYYSAKAEFHIELHEFSSALEALEKAHQMASMDAEKTLLKDRISFCLQKIRQ